MSYGFEWIPGLGFLGVVLLLAVPPFGVIAVLVVALAVFAALVAAIVATPYLLVRTVRRHLAEQHRAPAHQPTERPHRIATAIPHAAGAGNR